MWSGDGALDKCAARLRGHTAALRRARWRLAAWCVACAAAAALYVALVPAQFVAQVEVVLAPQAIANDGPEDVRHYHQIDLDSEQAATELQILRSERLLRPVFDKLALSESVELMQSNDGFWRQAAHLAHRLAPGDPAYGPRERAYFAFASRVRCLQLGLSYVFVISYRSHDPALAAQVANAVAVQYLADRIEREKVRRERFGGAYGTARSEALKRQEEIGQGAAGAGVALAEDLPAASARILGAATPPLSKSYPKTAPTLALGGFFGLFSGVLAILAFGADTAADRRRASFQEWASEAEVSTNSG